MRTIVLILSTIMLPACSLLPVSAKDVLPSLSLCHYMKYERAGLEAEIHAKCRVPVN